MLSLGTKANDHSQENYNFKNHVEIAIKKFEQHLNINLIYKNITNNENFHFSPADHEKILKEIINLDNKKMELLKTFLLAASRIQQMCVVLLQQISGMKKFCLAKIFQKILNWGMLHLTPIFKRKDKTFIENYRPVSVLPTVSKIFEQIMEKQITDYIVDWNSLISSASLFQIRNKTMATNKLPLQIMQKLHRKLKIHQYIFLVGQIYS